MPYGIFECSARAKAMIDPNAKPDQSAALAGAPSKYSLETLLIGQAIAVPYDAVKESSFRVYVTRQGNKLKRKFTVIRHDEAKVYEVARIG